MVCGDTKIMRQDVADTDCFTTMCTDVDLDTCCEDRASCSSLTCATGSAHGPETLCAGAACDDTTEQSLCCYALGQCSAYTCTGDNNVKRADAPEYCNDADCGEDECCVIKQLCSAGGLDCGNGKGLKVDAASIFCAGEACADDDKTACCEDKEACSGMTGGDGKMYCSSFTSCATGTIQDAASTECEDGVCTDALCCVQAYGPPINDVLEEPAVQDTFTAGFKLEECSFESLTADQTLVDALEENICEEFAATTQTDASWCSVEFSAGSVNVKVTIMAPVGETLPAASTMKTPEPANIITAVTATEGIEATQQGGKPIGVSDVKAVVFKTGETSAAEVLPPTPPSPPPTPPATTTAADDADEDTDSAVRLHGTALLMGVVMIVPVLGF